MKTKKSPLQESALEKIKEFTEKGIAVTDDGLAYASAVTEYATLGVRQNNQDIEISELVQKLIEDYQDVAKEKGIDLSIELKGKYVIYADKSIIYEKIFRNLMQNVIDHSEAKNLKLSLEKTTKRGVDYALVTFEDNGKGIRNEKLNEMFILFKTSKQVKYEGSRQRGFGLPTALKASALYSGDIEINSTEGIGTKFLVYLPIKEEKHD